MKKILRDFSILLEIGARNSLSLIWISLKKYINLIEIFYAGKILPMEARIRIQVQIWKSKQTKETIHRSIFSIGATKR